MSFHRHWEIFPSDKGATLLSYALAHRLDEFPAGYSSAGCSPASPASASPAGYEYALQSSCWSRIFHRTANSVLTVCLSPGGHRIVVPSSSNSDRFRGGESKESRALMSCGKLNESNFAAAWKLRANT